MIPPTKWEWLDHRLNRIEAKLDLILKQFDFSKEDAVVLQATEEIKQHLPPEQNQKGK